MSNLTLKFKQKALYTTTYTMGFQGYTYDTPDAIEVWVRTKDRSNLISHAVLNSWNNTTATSRAQNELASFPVLDTTVSDPLVMEINFQRSILNGIEWLYQNITNLQPFKCISPYSETGGQYDGIIDVQQLKTTGVTAYSFYLFWIYDPIINFNNSTSQAIRLSLGDNNKIYTIPKNASANFRLDLYAPISQSRLFPCPIFMNTASGTVVVKDDFGVSIGTIQHSSASDVSLWNHLSFTNQHVYTISQ